MYGELRLINAVYLRRNCYIFKLVLVQERLQELYHVQEQKKLIFLHYFHFFLSNEEYLLSTGHVILQEIQYNSGYIRYEHMLRCLS
jgi:hypothetical protein